MCYEEWSEFYQDSTSPSGLRWHGRSRNGPNGKARQTGDVAGVRNNRGYWIVYVRGKSRRVHRVLLEMALGRELHTSELVDHKSGDCSDNDPVNIHIVTRQGNARNCKLASDSTTGIVGVSHRTVKHGEKLYKVYDASYTADGGKQVRRSFSVGKYGEAGAKRLASEWRTARVLELKGSSASYSERHGKRKALVTNIIQGELQ